MKVKPFLPESAEFSDRVTELYDFVWPTAAAMWNLRWQVQGFLAVQPNAPKQVLHARFVEGSGIRGENLERACIEYDWQRQQEHFARILLVNLFAHYESWCKSMRERFAAPEAVEKDLQFWERTVGPKKKPKLRRFVDAVSIMALQPSVPMASAFGAVYKASERHSGAHLKAMLLCLRFFKELRNCIAHHGAVASQTLVDAYTTWQPLATPKELGATEVPRHVPPVLALPCKVDLRGVVGLGGVLVRIVETVDADLVGTKQAEDAFEARWKQQVGSLKLKTSKVNPANQIRYAAGQMGILQPVVTDDLLACLRKRHLAM